MEFTVKTGKSSSPAYKPLYIPTSKYHKQMASGEVDQEEIKYPAKLGVKPPFDDLLTTQLYDEVGYVAAYIDKYVNRVFGPGWTIDGTDKQITILEQWEEDTGFRIIAREWLREALYKRGGFLNIGYNKKGIPDDLKLLDGRSIFVVRKKTGVVEGYNQYFGFITKGAHKPDFRKVKPFKTKDIAPLYVKKTGDRAYGLGVLSQNIDAINDYMGAVKNLHKLVDRKANSPLHVKIGSNDPEGPQPSQADIDDVKGDVQTMTSETEFVTDGMWEIKAIDFGDFGKKFEEIIDTDRKQLDRGFQVPQVIMGDGSIPEGLADEQGQDWEVTAKAIQQQMSYVMVEQLYKPILQAQSIDSTGLRIRWDVNTEKEKARRIATLQSLLSLPELQPSLRGMVEIDLAEQLGYDVDLLMTPEERREEFENRPAPQAPGENAPRNSMLNKHPHTQTLGVSEGVRERRDNGVDPFSPGASVSEWLGFDYQDFLKKIREAIKEDSFDLLKAKDVIEQEAGRLSKNQIKALKKSLDKGIAKELTMKEIAKDIEENVAPQDLYEVKDGSITDKKLASAENRPMSIARSEVTRMANEGAIRQYEEAGLKKYAWLASSDACPECESLNNNIYKMRQGPVPPLHTNCRCTTVAVTEDL